MKFKIGDRVRINAEHPSANAWPMSVKRALQANHVFIVKQLKEPDRFEPVILDTSSWPHDIYSDWAENELVHARKPTIVVML